jgi:mutator protein MutT
MLAVRLQNMSTESTAAKERIDAPIAIVVRDQLVLITQRKADDTLGGYWEFPGGKCELGETLEQCLARELREEIDIIADPTHRLETIEHDYPTALVRLHPFVCLHVEGEPKLIECQDARWIEPTALRDYQFPPANERLIEAVIKLLR